MTKKKPRPTAKVTDLIWERIQRATEQFEQVANAQGIYHRGYRFWPPYACSRCGEPISARQFAFARSCGGCDQGPSVTARLHVFDPRWFLLGKAELENPDDTHLIRPEFIPAHTRREFWPVWPIPRPPRVKPPRKPPRGGLR